MKTDLQHLRERYIGAAGQLTQTFGFGRIMGQIYMHLYFSAEPQSLDDLAERLHISKGSASTTVRQLEAWGALRQVWIKGDRKDYYQTTEEFGRIIRKALQDLIGRHMESADRLLDESDAQLGNGKAAAADKDLQFFRQRVARLRTFRKRAQGLWESPLIRLLMK
jgi:DNA-binding transcriptional regulator GbsR (MarR family)